MIILILFLFSLIIAVIFFLFLLIKKRKAAKRKKIPPNYDGFNVKQPVLDQTNTIYQTLDGQVEIEYTIPTVKVHFSNNREINITKWYINEENLLLDFKEFSKTRFLKTELDEILHFNGLNLSELRTAVYNNKDIYVKDSQQVFICLFVTFGFYDQYWNVDSLNINVANLTMVIHKFKDKHKKKSTFIKCE